MKKKPAKRTDTERLNALQGLLGKYTGKVDCRWSTTSRGWRLYETTTPSATPDIRQAIDRFLDENQSISDRVKTEAPH